jgi:hypothetical protein
MSISSSISGGSGRDDLAVLVAFDDLFIGHRRELLAVAHALELLDRFTGRRVDLPEADSPTRETESNPN